MRSFPMGGISKLQSFFLLVVVATSLFQSDVAALQQCHQSEKTCTTDLTSTGQWNESYAGMILSTRLEYEEMPLICQIDHGLCRNWTTVSYAKGDIAWPLTEIGTRRVSRCAYAYTEDQYVHSDCIVDVEGAAVWTNLDDTICPLPPFSRQVEALDVSLANTTVLEGDECSVVIESMDQLVRIRRENPSHPFFHEDRNTLNRVCMLWIEDCYLNNHLEQMTINIWNVSDIMLNETTWATWHTDDYERFILTLEWLFPRYQSSPPIHSQNFHYKGDVLEAKQWNRKDGRLEYDFLETNGNGISGSVTINSNRTLHNARMFLVKTIYDMFKVTVVVEHVDSSFDLDDINGTSSAEETLFRLAIGYQPSNIILSSLVFLKYDESEVAAVDEEMRIVFRHPQLSRDFGSALSCGNAIRSSEELESTYRKDIRNSTTIDLTRWSTEKCRIASIVDYTVTCICAGAQGFFALLGPDTDKVAGNRPYDDVADVSVFLGFPYIEELNIAGKVLRAISLVCLVITILSYSIFSKTRRGTPTRILLNLCISLIVLLVVLYIAEYQAGSRMGCRVLNVFRYYLVLVSLLWNAIEAHNMYKMLIKVFNAETSHFVLIAGIFAWGAPAVFVAIALAVDRKAFDGTYFNCKFRCSLQQNTLIYGWILPMSLIIAHNLIVFSMVLFKVLLKRDPASPNLKVGSAKSHVSRLIGAFTMLVLLGVPWIFSAFGVIDTGNSSTVLKHLEGIFNVVFIVCISLQGLFIFAFHCARIKDVRQHWKSAVKSGSSTLSSTIRDTTSGSNRANETDGREAKHTLRNNERL